jgi:hypothetical protein
MHEAHTHPHSVTRPYEDLPCPAARGCYLLLPGLYCCLDRTRKALLWRHFLPLGLDTSRHFYLEGKTHKLPAGRGFWGFMSGYGRVRSSSLIVRVWSGTGSPFIGTGRVGYGFYPTRRQPCDNDSDSDLRHLQDDKKATK